MDPLFSQFKIVWVKFNPYTVPSPFCGRNCCRSGSHKRVQNGIPRKTEHSDQSFGKFFRVRRGMAPGRSAGYAGPDRLKPLLVIFIGYYGQNTRCNGRFSIAPVLAFHQNVFNVILDNAVRFIRFTKEPAAISICFIPGIGDLVPDDRREIVIAYLSAMLLNGRVKRDDGMPAIVFSSGQTYVTYNADDSATGNQDPITVLPHPVQFYQEIFIIFNTSQLVFMIPVFLQSPIGWGSHHEMNGFIGDEG